MKNMKCCPFFDDVFLNIEVEYIFKRDFFFQCILSIHCRRVFNFCFLLLLRLMVMMLMEWIRVMLDTLFWLKLMAN